MAVSSARACDSQRAAAPTLSSTSNREVRPKWRVRATQIHRHVVSPNPLFEWQARNGHWPDRKAGLTLSGPRQLRGHFLAKPPALCQMIKEMDKVERRPQQGDGLARLRRYFQHRASPLCIQQPFPALIDLARKDRTGVAKLPPNRFEHVDQRRVRRLAWRRCQKN